jgi:hypothetical protein
MNMDLPTFLLRSSKKVLWISVIALILVGCSSDDEVETTNYDSTYNVSYYNQDPGINTQQGYWYQEKFIELIPQKEPPFTLLVKWDNEEGKKALDYIVGKNDGVVQRRIDYGEPNSAIIISNKYILCPNLFVSSSYKTSESSPDTDCIRISNEIIVKMKEGKSYDIIEKDYANVLKYSTKRIENLNWPQVFCCSLRTSREVLKLAEEINHRDDVEWAEPDMYGYYSFGIKETYM